MSISQEVHVEKLIIEEDTKKRPRASFDSIATTEIKEIAKLRDSLFH